MNEFKKEKRGGIMDIKKENYGKKYHINSVELFPKNSQVKRDDLIYLTDYKSQNSGRILISESEFIDSLGNMPFHFRKNNETKGMANQNTGIISFCRKIKNIKEDKPLQALFCKITKIDKNKVTVVSEDGKVFMIQYGRNVNATIGNVIWGNINKDYSDFESLSFEGYPKNSIQIA